MKLKYYMRGLGIGIVVAAVLMGIALGGDKERLSDDEIMARAKALGMVESSVLADLNKEKETETISENDTQSEMEDETQEPSQDEPVKEQQSEPKDEPQTEPEKEPQSEPEKEPQSEPKDEPQTEPEKEPQTEPDNQPDEEAQNPPQEDAQEEYVTLVIERGESSVSVSRSLAELGLVESAKDYDRYLCSNGYDKSIKVGTHKIKVGSTEKEIAEIISRKKK
jgi:outer membrane biosynthesis protein TonB